jgi:hypothetical protein
MAPPVYRTRYRRHRFPRPGIKLARCVSTKASLLRATVAPNGISIRTAGRRCAKRGDRGQNQRGEKIPGRISWWPLLGMKSLWLAPSRRNERGHLVVDAAGGPRCRTRSASFTTAKTATDGFSVATTTVASPSGTKPTCLPAGQRPKSNLGTSSEEAMRGQNIKRLPSDR